MAVQPEKIDSPKFNYEADGDLVRACMKGSQHAWTELVARYSRLVYSIPLKRGFSHDDAHEVMQNVFTNLFRGLHNLHNHRCLAKWLITTTQRECHQMARSFTSSVELTEFVNDPMNLTDESNVWERQHMVREALRLMEPEYRELLTALFLESDSSKYADVANRLDLPVGSIGPMRARAFKKLEVILRSMGYEGD